MSRLIHNMIWAAAIAWLADNGQDPRWWDTANRVKQMGSLYD